MITGDCVQVDLIHFQHEVVCDDAGRHGFACSGIAGKEDVQTAFERGFFIKTQGPEYVLLLVDLIAHFMQMIQGFIVQDDVLPGEFAFHLCR